MSRLTRILDLATIETGTMLTCVSGGWQGYWTAPLLNRGHKRPPWRKTEKLDLVTMKASTIETSVKPDRETGSLHYKSEDNGDQRGD